jgi:hypothetical protein
MIYPDGSEEYLECHRNKIQRQYGILVSNADGSEPYFLSASTAEGIFIDYDFSPDWQKIAYIPSDEPKSIYIMNSDRSELRKIIEGEMNEYIPYLSWSPDGTKILFYEVDDPVTKLLVMNADGSGLTLLDDWSPTSLWNFSPYHTAWSPDNKKIAYYAGEAFYNVINPDGTAKTRIGCIPKKGFSWSPDGKKIICALDEHSVGIINSDGTDPVVLLKSANNISFTSGPWTGSFDWTP